MEQKHRLQPGGAAVTGTVYFFFLNKKGNLTKLWHESGLDWGGGGWRTTFCKHCTINRSNSRFCTMHVMTYVFLLYNFRSSSFCTSCSLSFSLLIVAFFFFLLYNSSAKHHKWTILYSSNVIYKNERFFCDGGVGGGRILQICSTVHVICHIKNLQTISYQQ